MNDFVKSSWFISGGCCQQNLTAIFQATVNIVFCCFFLNALLTHKIVTTVLQEKKKDHTYTYSKAI